MAATLPTKGYGCGSLTLLLFHCDHTHLSIDRQIDIGGKNVNSLKKKCLLINEDAQSQRWKSGMKYVQKELCCDSVTANKNAHRTDVPLPV